MSARNLLLVTLDSVRADHFRGPVLDRLIGEPAEQLDGKPAIDTPEQPLA